jgi:hypothetical protein
MKKIVASQHALTDLPRRGFRIAEAAIYMGVTPWYVEQIIRSKQLPALKLRVRRNAFSWNTIR